VFLSFSTVINGRSPNHKALIAACSPDRILVESDFNDIDECTGRTWDMVHSIASIKGWHVEEEWIEDLLEINWGAVRRLEQNWFSFKRRRTASDSIALH